MLNRHPRQTFPYLLLLALLALLAGPAAAAGDAYITVNQTVGYVNATINISGFNFTPTKNHTVMFLVENNTSWWDGYKEQWALPVYIQSNSTGGFSFLWTVPKDWRLSPGKVLIKVGESVGSAMNWSSQETQWTTSQVGRTAMTGDRPHQGPFCSL